MSHNAQVALALVLTLLSGPAAAARAGGMDKKDAAPDKTQPLDLKDKLASTGPLDARRNDTPYKTHAVKLLKDKAYEIRLVSTDFDPYLRLEDASGRALAEDDDSGGELNALIVFQPPADGVYHVIATAFNQDAAGQYHLTVVEEKPRKDGLDVRARLERGDPPDRIRSGPSKVHIVQMTKGKVYRIDMTSTEFDAFLRLESPTGQPLAANDDGGGNLNARIDFHAPADGRYRIIATTFTGDIGNYRLTVGANKDVLPAQIQDLQVDANVRDRLDAQDPICDRAPVRNHPCKSYRVTLKAGTSYVIDLESTDFDAYLFLVGSNRTSVAADDDSGGSLNARIVYTPDADGTFFIVATALDDRLGNFTVKIRKQ